MHIVIAGESELALRITEALMDDHDVVLITTEPTAVARLDNFDVHVIQGIPSSLKTLEEARTDRADYFIAASDSDERNVVGCIAAGRLGATRRVCVIHSATDPELDVLDDESLASSVGIDAVIRPAEQLTNEILRIVKVPGALDVRSFRGGRVGLLKAVVEPGSAIAEHRLSAQRLPAGVRLAMVHRGDEFFVPAPSTKLEPDDRVTLIGHPRRLVKFARQRFRGPEHQRERRRAVICGGGTVGFGVAKGLREAGWWVKLIEHDLARCEFLSERLDCLVLHGDGSDIDLLREEHVETSAVLIAVTNNDEKNLLISLIAKQLGVDRIITRADRRVNERVFDSVGIDVVLSQRGAAVRSVVSDIVHADREHIAELEHGALSVLDLTLPAEWRPRPLALVKPPAPAGVGAIIRGKRTIFPKDETELRPGDHVIVVTVARDEDAVRGYFCHQADAHPIETIAASEEV